ncbi:hypothetical protein CASFOL_030518 [Castilleja foliolosa]|uniref:Uncharacterized protein n=1 Tax=Castilleja foliolosa TaxID=1961234 RepID=A0ABD3C7W0_9LAMI
MVRGSVTWLRSRVRFLWAGLWSMKIGTKPMVEDFLRSVVIERDEKGRQWRGNRRTLIWGVTQFRKTLIEEGNSKSAGTAVLVRGFLVLVDGIGWGGGRFLVPELVDGGALKWRGLTTEFCLGGVAPRRRKTAPFGGDSALVPASMGAMWLEVGRHIDFSGEDCKSLPMQ